MRKISTVIAPFIVLFFAWALASKAELAGEAVQSLIKVVPFIIALLALFMSAWYQNSNSFYLVCFILVSYIFITIASLNTPMLNEAVAMSSILLPINAVWLGFAKERGIVSTYGRNKAIIVVLQLTWIFINMMGKSSITIGEEVTRPFTGIRVPAIVIYILAISILLSSYILRKEYMHLIFATVLLTSVISFFFADRILLVATFTAAIFVIIVLALFDVSYSLAFYDPLTGVLSRRALEQELMKLGNRKYSIAMVDLDHFKHINDKYGHDVGDEVLKMVASLLDKTSGMNKVFRYGGEEFIVLFYRTPYNEIMPQLERMRKAVERRPFVIRGDNRPKEKPDKKSPASARGRGTIHVTVSIGLASKSDLLKTHYDVIRKADEALYKSKNGGRNCVTKI